VIRIPAQIEPPIDKMEVEVMATRPEIWIGHVDLRTTNLKGSTKFLEDVGLRHVFANEEMVIVELRGGTHLIMFERDELENPESYFDFMVEDIDVMYSRLDKLGYPVTDIERGEIHDTFYVREPGGNRIRVNSSHVDDHAAV
jgi:catechol-2,3-dioxygenase